jgi:hypothetical protein
MPCEGGIPDRSPERLGAAASQSSAVETETRSMAAMLWPWNFSAAGATGPCGSVNSGWPRGDGPTWPHPRCW